MVLSPTEDDLSVAESTPRENDFEFGGDREGLSCPFAAHVRKAYPRDDVEGNTSPTEKDVAHAEASTQTHRMMRRGIAFGPELTHAEALGGTTTEERGLLFKCYVTSIVDQFEFVQRSWVNERDFVQPGSGVDPIIGQPDGAATPFLGAAPFSRVVAEKPQLNVSHFVHMQGGDYFFAPAVDQLRAL